MTLLHSSTATWLAALVGAVLVVDAVYALPPSVPNVSGRTVPAASQRLQERVFQEQPSREVDAERHSLVWRSERVCGLNCLYSLLRHFGHAADYREMDRQLLHTGLTSLTELRRAAAERGLDARLGRTDFAGLERLPKPLIAHLDLVSPRGEASGHFVLVTGLDSAAVQCVDGTTAEPQSIDRAAFHRQWTGHILYVPERGLTRSRAYALLVLAGIAVAWGIERSWRGLRTIHGRAVPTHEVPA